MRLAEAGGRLMLTGRQIRQARILLGLTPTRLAEKARIVTAQTVRQAEACIGQPPILESHLQAIRDALERSGIRFTARTVELNRDEQSDIEP